MSNHLNSPKLLLSACVLAALALGCSISPPKSELAREAELEKTREAYRPNGERPALPQLTTESSVDDFARYAVLNSPRVEESFHAWAKSVAEITIARSLPDPSLSLEVESGRMLEAVRVGFQGSYPGPGKLVLAAEAQSSAAAARRHEFEQAAIEAAFRVRVAWLRAAWLAEVTAVRREIVATVTDIEDLASAQYRVGKVSQQDVLRVQIERDEVDTEIASLEDSRELILAEMRSALGLAASESPPLPAKLPVTLSQPPSGDLLDQALANNHRLLALREEIRESESMVALARKSSQPDYMLGLGVDLVSPIVLIPAVGVTLPIYRDKIAALVASALASRHVADSRLSGATLDLVVQLADAHFRFRDANRRLELVRDKLLPKATSSLDAARAAYPTGMTDMTGLLDAERMLLGFRVDEITMRMERASALAEIELVILGSRDVSQM